MNDQHIKTDLAQQLETLTNFQQMFHLRFSVFLFFLGGERGIEVEHWLKMCLLNQT